ncbi:hypothetical protein CAPTEDRAFT_202220 [Capitella teleta]|uniref:Uncharacterized protein n=1 Tax=Capitella teleta TaxID=283909 RepID=R7UZW0_CAPTE|nr:hypothetical protein CAPTEDRAFT_202220 [Capitella teleta]|eukprot:ELU12118.1 hypothetical protein CAPTEDRAFT_202220 [Capitella teleta]
MSNSWHPSPRHSGGSSFTATVSSVRRPSPHPQTSVASTLCLVSGVYPLVAPYNNPTASPQPSVPPDACKGSLRSNGCKRAAVRYVTDTTRYVRGCPASDAIGKDGVCFGAHVSSAVKSLILQGHFIDLAVLLPSTFEQYKSGSDDEGKPAKEAKWHTALSLTDFSSIFQSYIAIMAEQCKCYKCQGPHSTAKCPLGTGKHLTNAAYQSKAVRQSYHQPQL